MNQPCCFQANDYCYTTWNSYLASVMSEDEQTYITGVGAADYSDLWIGLSDEVTDICFKIK